jgi:hypothetical protein
MQHLGVGRFHNNEKVEIAVREWLFSVVTVSVTSGQDLDNYISVLSDHV